MDVFPYDWAEVVGRFEIFTEIRGSGFELFGFGNKFYQKENDYEKVIII